MTGFEEISALREALATATRDRDAATTALARERESARRYLAAYDELARFFARGALVVATNTEGRAWLFDLPSVDGEGWARVVLYERDRGGTLMACSDWGNYAYHFPNVGPGGFLQAVLRMPPDYLADKLVRKVFDAHATQKAAREALAVSGLCPDDKLDEEELIAGITSRGGWEVWTSHTKVPAPWETFHEIRDPRAVAFVEKTMPRVKDAVRALLNVEETRAHAAAP